VKRVGDSRRKWRADHLKLVNWKLLELLRDLHNLKPEKKRSFPPVFLYVWSCLYNLLRFR
jgi:hypothetical protein